MQQSCPAGAFRCALQAVACPSQETMPCLAHAEPGTEPHVFSRRFNEPASSSGACVASLHVSSMHHHSGILLTFCMRNQPHKGSLPAVRDVKHPSYSRFQAECHSMMSRLLACRSDRHPGGCCRGYGRWRRRSASHRWASRRHALVKRISSMNKDFDECLRNCRSGIQHR